MGSAGLVEVVEVMDDQATSPLGEHEDVEVHSWDPRVAAPTGDSDAATYAVSLVNSVFDVNVVVRDQSGAFPPTSNLESPTARSLRCPTNTQCRACCRYR